MGKVLGFPNFLDTIVSYLKNENTSQRTFLFPDYDGSVQVNKYDVEEYGAEKASVVYDAGMSTGGGGTTLTSATASFTSDDVGKIFVLQGAAASGRDLVGTISALISPTSVTTSLAAGTTVTNAKLIYGIDCTTAFQNAINDCYNGGGGEVIIGVGYFLIGGALQTSVGGYNPNSQLYFPVSIPANNNRPNIIIRGIGGTTPSNSQLSSNVTLPSGGTVVFSTLTSSSGTSASLFGSGGEPSSPNIFNHTHVDFYDLTISSVGNPAGAGPVVGGINGGALKALSTYNVTICPDIAQFLEIQPTNEVCGLIQPHRGANNQNTYINTFVSKYKYGIVLGDMASLVQCGAMDCDIGLVVCKRNHTSYALRFQLHRCKRPIFFASSSLFGDEEGDTYVSLNVEGEFYTSGKWNTMTTFITDPNNYGRGKIEYALQHTSSGTPDNSLFSMNGGENLVCTPLFADSLKVLTESSATRFLRLSIASGEYVGGEVVVSVQANSASEFQIRTLRFIFSAVNKSGTITVTLGTPEEVVAVSSGTLTAEITAVDSGSGNLDFKVNAVSSLSQTSLRAKFSMTKNFKGILYPQ